MAEGIEVRHTSRGKSYRASVWDPRARKLIKRTFPNMAEAKAWRVDALAALRAGTLARPTKTTIATAADALLEGMKAGTVLDRSGRQYKPATVRSYEQAVGKYVKPRLGSLKLSELRRADVQRYVNELHASGLSPSTVANKLDPVRVIVREALAADVITVDPTRHLRLPQVRNGRDRIEAPDRAAALIAALPEAERGFWSTAFYAGLRRGELRALRWDDVDFDAGVIRVRRGWDDKEGEIEVKSDAGRRNVPLAGVLRRELAAHKLRTGRQGGDLVFGRTADLPFTASTIRARALKAWRAAGLEPLTPHEARHCAASYFIAAGYNAKQISVYIGHGDVRQTWNRYGHLMPGDEVTAAAQLDAFFDRAAAIGSS
jgi:integrase